MKKKITAFYKLFTGLELSKEVLAQMAEISQQLDEEKELSPTDKCLITELAITSQRGKDLTHLAAEAKEDGDVDLYMKLSKGVETCTTAKRGLLRDLRGTRNSATSDAHGKVTAKAKSKSGADWTGI